MLWPLVVFVLGASALLLAGKAGTVVLAVWRKSVEDHTAIERDKAHKLLDLERRKVTVEERRVSLEERQYQKPERVPPMPQALVARCLSWEDTFAQEAERQRLNELFAELGDWDTVMQNLDALTPEFRDEIAAPREGLLQ